ncbi:MAG TPA: PQQ-dependent sugar dehydrogenase [Solirubrobacterales bacterium]
MRISLSRRRIETFVAALVAIGAAIAGIVVQEGRTLGPKFVTLQRIARLSEPVYLTQPPGQNSQLYVVQKRGAVRIIANDHLLARPFLDIHRLVRHNGPGGDPGMAGIAFPRDYARSGRFYVSYNDRQGNLQVDEFRRSAGDPRLADPSSRRPILSIPEPTEAHHGGSIVFGPDGYLYLGTGDGGPAGDPAGNAQNLDLLLGKLLRIDPTPTSTAATNTAAEQRPYTIPPDNPFVGRPGRDEIWAYGLRNPRRFSFDRPTKTIGIGDVGNNRYEEIDYLSIAKSRGANFGWPAYEGFAVFKGGITRRDTVFPALAYPHRPGCAVTGGYVVRDPRLARIRGREIVGDYMFADYCTGKLYGFRPRLGRRAGKQRSFRFNIRYLSSLGEDDARHIYVLTERGLKQGTKGSVYRLVPFRKEI